MSSKKVIYKWIPKKRCITPPPTDEILDDYFQSIYENSQYYKIPTKYIKIYKKITQP